MRSSFATLTRWSFTSLLTASLTVAVSIDALADEAGVVFREDFESGIDGWEVLDSATWKLSKNDGKTTFKITKRESDFVPQVRSPGHAALVKDLELESFEITFRVRSTKDTGNHGGV